MGAAMKLTDQGRMVLMLRAAIPTFDCVPGCHDCCGPVMASEWEMKRLPVPVRQFSCKTSTGLDCPHLSLSGCTVYDERPLICRVYGTTPSLPCPRGQKPAKMLSPKLEAEFKQFGRKTAHELIADPSVLSALTGGKK